MLRTLLGLIALSAASCTGMTWGENEPGGDTYVDPPDPLEGQHRMGAIAVEPDEDQLWVVHEELQGGISRAHLSAIDPVLGTSTEVLDVSNTADRRVVFPADDRMILMAQAGSADQLVLFDTTTRTKLASVVTTSWYHGTRTSPSGRALVVADNNQLGAPLHVIDTQTLGHQVIEHDGDLVEAMWNHAEDTLFVVSANHQTSNTQVVHIRRYDLAGADLSAPLPAQSWQLDGFGWDGWFSYTWISISPDGRYAVFPLIDRQPSDANGADFAYTLVILDQATGELSQAHGRGPVGFTRDGQTIVSYGDRADGSGAQDLWLVDAATRARKVVAMPFAGTLMFHPSLDSDHIVCTPVLGSGTPVVYDIAADVVRPIATPTLGLTDFVTRPGYGELWLQSGGSVFSLALATATLALVDVHGAIAGSINVRPAADQAVVGDLLGATIQRFSMATRLREGDAIALPRPHSTTAPGSLSARLAATAGAQRDAQSAFDPSYRAPRTVRPGRWLDPGRADARIIAR